MRKYPVLLGLLVSCLAVPVIAPASPASAAPADCGAPTTGALADYFDNAVPASLGQYRVPGAVVSVVSGDATVFTRGYGLADREDGVAFDPDRSLVRLASITKLFTWTAVMQQVQAGRLDLDADVNRYLTAFTIPRTYPEPVTLRALMDHTAGFEDQIIGTGARTAADVVPLEQYLAANMPARIRPPGQISAYSNYGAALAGYLVAKVSGQPFDEYVQQHLFGPLGMAHSTATEPVPPALAGDLARSYNSDAEPVRRVPFEFDPLTPDGSISATAADVAHFMTAHLNDGRFGSTSILSPATTAQMHERSFSADPRLGGYAHGFMDRTMNGHRVLLHDGSWEGFLSLLLLVPGCRLGLFISANSTGGVEAVTQLLPGFLDRFVPVPATPDATPTPAAVAPGTPATPLAGFYQPARHNESTVEKIVNLLGPARLVVDADGTVHFRGKTWTAQGDGLYQPADGSDHLVFFRGPDGRRYVATDGPTFQLMSTGETLPVNLAVLLAVVLVALSAAVVLLVGLVRRIRHRTRATTTDWRWARGLANGAAILGLGFLVGLVAILLGNAGDFLFGVPIRFRILLLAPVGVLLLAVVALALTVKGWRGSGAGLPARVHQVVVFVGLAALTWFTWQWNLLGWQF